MLYYIKYTIAPSGFLIYDPIYGFDERFNLILKYE